MFKYCVPINNLSIVSLCVTCIHSLRSIAFFSQHVQCRMCLGFALFLSQGMTASVAWYLWLNYNLTVYILGEKTGSSGRWAACVHKTSLLASSFIFESYISGCLDKQLYRNILILEITLIGIKSLIIAIIFQWSNHYYLYMKNVLIWILFILTSWEYGVGGFLLLRNIHIRASISICKILPVDHNCYLKF